jgi:hypothetical protein
VGATLRIGLRTISLFTLGAAGWLVAVIVSGRAARGQDLVLLWSLVAVGSVVLVATSVIATRPATPPPPLSAVVLAALGLAALAFGLFVLGSELTAAVGREPEGYVFGLGLILAVHGALACAWVLLRAGRLAA